MAADPADAPLADVPQPNNPGYCLPTAIEVPERPAALKIPGVLSSLSSGVQNSPWGHWCISDCLPRLHDGLRSISGAVFNPGLESARWMSDLPALTVATILQLQHSGQALSLPPG